VGARRADPDLGLARFRALLDAYECEPTLANYLRFRRAFRGADTEIGWLRDFEPASIETELRQFGIDPWLVSDALEGAADKIDELALQLMEQLVERERLEKNGKSHLQSRKLVISDGLIDFLAVAALQASAASDEGIPPSLVVLIGDRLAGSTPDRHKEFLREQRKKEAIARAAINLPKEKVSIRRVAAMMDVEPSTVSRWFPDSDLAHQVEVFRRSIDALGLRRR